MHSNLQYLNIVGLKCHWNQFHFKSLVSSWFGSNQSDLAPLLSSSVILLIWGWGFLLLNADLSAHQEFGLLSSIVFVTVLFVTSEITHWIKHWATAGWHLCDMCIRCLATCVRIRFSASAWTPTINIFMFLRVSKYNYYITYNLNRIYTALSHTGWLRSLTNVF